MKKETIISSFVGLIVGVLIVSFLFGVCGWNSTGWKSMMSERSYDDSGSIMGASMTSAMDRYFIEQMIPHHDDAILMAEIALMKAEYPEIKELAQNIKSTQTEENKKMRELYVSWTGSDVLGSAHTMGMGQGMMMHGGMMRDETDITKLESAKPFDKEFIEQMIPHHQMAIMMATMIFQGTEREEMKTLAQVIINAQSKEIDQMRSWYRSWYRN